MFNRDKNSFWFDYVATNRTDGVSLRETVFEAKIFEYFYDFSLRPE